MNVCWSCMLSKMTKSLQWRHNERNGVSNHRRLDFFQTFDQAQIKENHWPVWWEITGDRWIPLTKGQLRGKYSHLMTSSCTTIRSLYPHGYLGPRWPEVSLSQAAWHAGMHGRNGKYPCPVTWSNLSARIVGYCIHPLPMVQYYIYVYIYTYIYIIVEKSPNSSHMYDHGFMDNTNRQAVCKSQKNPLSDSQTAEELHWKP